MTGSLIYYHVRYLILEVGHDIGQVGGTVLLVANQTKKILMELIPKSGVFA